MSSVNHPPISRRALWASKNKEKVRQIRKRYVETHREQYNAYQKRYAVKLRAIPNHNKVRYQRTKLRALRKISGLEIPECNRCGCDELRFLEINHKNGGGTRERKQSPTSGLCQEVASGKRETSDLNVLCRVCNAVDYLERKYGDVKQRFLIQWLIP